MAGDVDGSQESLSSSSADVDSNMAQRFVVQPLLGNDEWSAMDLPIFSSDVRSMREIQADPRRERDAVSVGNLSAFSQLTPGLVSSPGSILSLLSAPGSIIGLSVLSASQNYLNIYREVGEGAGGGSNVHLEAVAEENEEVGDIFDNPEYIDTLEGKLPLAEAAKIIAKDSTRHSSLFDSSHIRATRNECYKRLVCVGLVFLLTYSTSYGVRFTSNSLGEDKTLLLLCYGLIFSLQWFGAIISHPIISKIGPKWTMLLSTSGFILYPVSMYHMSYYTTFPASMYISFCTGVLWAVEGVYLINAASTYALVSKDKLFDVISRFNGLVFAFFMSANITGNLLSSLLLSKLYTLPGELESRTLSHPQSNSTADLSSISPKTLINFPISGSNFTRMNSSSSPTVCGLQYYDLIKDHTVEQFYVYSSKEYLFYGAASLMSVMAALIVIVFLYKLEVVKRPGSGSILGSLRVFLTTFIDCRTLLLLPSIVNMALVRTAILADYNTGFVSCSYGVDKIGYVTMVASCFSAVGAYMCSRIIKFTGRLPVFIFNLLLNLSSVIFMLFWSPVEGTIQAASFIAPCLWGFSDGVLNSQASSFLGMLFQKTIVQAAACLLVGIAIGGLFGSFSIALGLFSLTVKLYVCIGINIFACLCYVLLEILLKRNILEFV